MSREAICPSLRASKVRELELKPAVLNQSCQTCGHHHMWQRQSARHRLPAADTTVKRGDKGGGGYSQSNPKIPLRED